MRGKWFFHHQSIHYHLLHTHHLVLMLTTHTNKRSAKLFKACQWWRLEKFQILKNFEIFQGSDFEKFKISKFSKYWIFTSLINFVKFFKAQISCFSILEIFQGSSEKWRLALLTPPDFTIICPKFVRTLSELDQIPFQNKKFGHVRTFGLTPPRGGG